MACWSASTTRAGTGVHRFGMPRRELNLHQLGKKGYNYGISMIIYVYIYISYLCIYIYIYTSYLCIYIYIYPLLMMLYVHFLSGTAFPGREYQRMMFFVVVFLFYNHANIKCCSFFPNSFDHPQVVCG